MADPTIAVPHLALPLSLGVGNTFACVEQDSQADVEQGVYVVLSTPLGSCIELPDYGYPDQTFRQAGGLDLAAAADVVAEWQPRATIDTSVSVDSVDELIEYVKISVDVESDDADA